MNPPAALGITDLLVQVSLSQFSSTGRGITAKNRELRNLEGLVFIKRSKNTNAFQNKMLQRSQCCAGCIHAILATENTSQSGQQIQTIKLPFKTSPNLSCFAQTHLICKDASSAGYGVLPDHSQ